MRVFIILLFAFKCISMLEIAFEQLKVEYTNEKYLKNFDCTVRRLSRKSPYIFNIYIDVKTGMGNNLTIKWSLYEVISGRDILTPIHFEYGLCNFLYKDPYLGHMLGEQIPKTAKCPFPPGVHNWTNVAVHLEYVPYIPFTYSSLQVRFSAVVEGYFGSEQIVRFRCSGVLKQNLTDSYAKKKPAAT